MLIKDVAAEFGGRVRVAIEEYGNSPSAERFGVRRYPVVFVDDILIARPTDFGFQRPEDTAPGRYTPWRDPVKQRRFKDDLRRFVVRRLNGEPVTGLDSSGVTAADADGPDVLPRVPLYDIAGRRVDSAHFTGRTVVVEMWATWCPPCRATLSWLGTIAQKYGDRVAIVAIAVDSSVEDVRSYVGELKPPFAIVLGTPEAVEAFGQVAAVPKLLVFDARGRRVNAFYGAPPDLHEQLDGAIARSVSGADPD